MSSSFGELLGLCHFRHSQVTPAISSSGGKGGNGTLHEVNRSTTSLNSLGRAERETEDGRGWGGKRQQRQSETCKWTYGWRQLDGRKKSNTKTDNSEGAFQVMFQPLNVLTSLPCRFLQQGGRNILKPETVWSLCTVSEVHSSTVQKHLYHSPLGKIVSQ